MTRNALSADFPAGAGQPEVSVIIPTRNRWSMLGSVSLPAALGQKGVDLEVIIVDDGSDETRRELADLDHPSVRLMWHARRLGVAAARNTGIAAARGNWVAFLDDDDLWSPEKLRLQLQVAASASADFVYSAAVLLDESGGLPLRLRAPAPSELGNWLRSSSAVPAGASNVLVRTEVVRRVGGFDDGFSHLADWDLWIRLEREGRCASCPEVLVAERLHDRNMRSMATRSVWNEFRRLAAKHRWVEGSAEPLDLDGRALLQWIAIQHARSGRRGSAAYWYVRAAAASRSPALLREAIEVLRSGSRARKAVSAPLPDWLAPL